jgi:uroporphyrinogen III methyltransferase/synthase
LIVIGDVVRLAPELAWFERRPLFGRRIVVTRPRHQVHAFAALLEAEGAEVISLPTIAPAPPASFDAFDAALAGLGGYAWLVLTSPHGVEVFFERLRALGRDLRELAGVAIAASVRRPRRASRRADSTSRSRPRSTVPKPSPTR